MLSSIVSLFGRGSDRQRKQETAKLSRRRVVALGLEGLETRKLMTAGMFRSPNGAISISGSDNDEMVVARNVGTMAEVSLYTAYTPGNYSLVQVFNVPVSSVPSITFTGGMGNDFFDGSGTSIKIIADGGDGNDTLLGGSNADNLNGGLDNDYLQGGAGNDTLTGGFGSDTFVFNASSALGTDTVIDTAAGAEGWADQGDTLDFQGSRFMLNVDLRKSSQQVNQFLWLSLSGDFENLYGGERDDNLTGTDSDNVITGGAGNDTILALNGSDVLEGGAGADSLNGGLGSDTYRYTYTGDKLAGDVIYETTNADVDTFDFSQSTVGVTIDLISSMPVNELNLQITMGSGWIENIEAGSGNDTLRGSYADNIILGGAGDDTIDGRNGNDWLYGEAGNDTINGRTGNDYIFGGAGNDTLNGDEGNDSLNGDAGIDTLNGGIDNDFLSGGDDNDTLSGNSGNDRLVGDGGNDWLYGGSGNDVLGALWAELYHYTARDTNGEDATFYVYYQVTDDSGDDHMFGGDNDDVVCGGTGNDWLYGDSGNDKVGAYRLVGKVRGVNDNDQRFTDFGEGGNDHIYGGDGKDQVDGGDGADTLHGDDGDDQIYVGSLYLGGFSDGAVDEAWGDGDTDEFHGGDDFDIYHKDWWEYLP